MKIWKGFGTEHSMNLVMIGRFKEAREAQDAKRLIDKLVEGVNSETANHETEDEGSSRRFSEEMFNLLEKAGLFVFSPGELQQFSYDVRVAIDGSAVVITTDEVDVSAFLKLLIDRGARVDVYSAHHYPDTGHGRGS